MFGAEKRPLAPGSANQFWGFQLSDWFDLALFTYFSPACTAQIVNCGTFG